MRHGDPHKRCNAILTATVPCRLASGSSEQCGEFHLPPRHLGLLAAPNRECAASLTLRGEDCHGKREAQGQHRPVRTQPPCLNRLDRSVPKLKSSDQILAQQGGPTEEAGCLSEVATSCFGKAGLSFSQTAIVRGATTRRAGDGQSPLPTISGVSITKAVAENFLAQDHRNVLGP